MRAIEHVENWRPDFVVVSGDIINRGPKPKECLQYVLKMAKSKNWLLLKGNHEDYVISQKLHNTSLTKAAIEVHRASRWTLHEIKDVNYLEALPFQQSIYDPNGNEIRFVHASMRGLRDGIYPETSDSDLKEKIKDEKRDDDNPHPALICVGHTHRPLVRNLSGIQIVNSGSVGLPFDKDQRLSYAQLEYVNRKWSANILRLEYDIGKAKEDFIQSGYIEEAGPLTKLVLVELETATSQLYNWSVKYQKSALSGKISMQESVNRHLQSLR